jgi:soluble lytic murein transglycosylase-like protein
MDAISRIDSIESKIEQIEERFSPPDQGQGSFQQVLSGYTQPLQPSLLPQIGMGKGIAGFKEIIQEAGKKYGVDPNLIAAVIHQESGGNPGVTSSAGAMGLMQLMPATAKSLGVNNPFNPQQNVFAGTRYLRQMLDEFKGNVSLALAAYNAGPEAVKKYGGIPPYRQTKNYVRDILSLYRSKNILSRNV